MKKILFLLLSTIAMYGQVPADATPLENIQITNNTTDNSATKVNVQSTDGTINTISKSDLVNVVEVNDVPSLPLTGVADKIYVVKNVNKIYRWNGTFYQELAGSDITYQSVIDALTFTPENVANKHNSLAVDGTGTKYPTVDAVNEGLSNAITKEGNSQTKIGGFTSGGVNYAHKGDIWIAIGTSVTATGNWTNPMAKQLNLNLINFGVGGSTSNDLVNHYSDIPTLTSGNKDDYRLLTIEYSINDAGTGVSLATFRSNLENGILNAKGKGWANYKIMLVNGNYCTTVGLITALQPYAEEVIKISKEQGVQYSDIYNYTKNNGGGLLLSDGIHPTAGGGVVYARGVIASMYGGGEFSNSLTVVNKIKSGGIISDGDMSLNGLISGDVTKVLPAGNTFTTKTINLTRTNSTSLYVNRYITNYNEDGFASPASNENFTIRLNLNKSTNDASGVFSALNVNQNQNGSGSLGAQRVVYSNFLGTGSGAVASVSLFAGLAGNISPTFSIGTYKGLDLFQTYTSNVTNAYGVHVGDLFGSTLSRGIDLGVNSGAGKYNIYVSGAAPNYFSGSLLIGTTVSNGNSFRLTGTMELITPPTISAGGYDLLSRSLSTGVVERIPSTVFAPNILTGYVSGAGSISATDNVLQAIQKLNGNDALKANLASPSLTGTPTAPTATAGANTTQVATTAFVMGADAGNVKLTGNQTISGQKSFSLTGKIDMQTNNGFPAITATALGSSNGQLAAQFINNSSSPYSSALNLQTGSSGGVGNRALDVSNQSPIGTGIFSNASSGGVSISSQSDTGDSYVSNITYGGTGRNYVGRNNGTETYSVDKTGSVTATQYKISALNTAPASATATGTLGEIRITAGFIYICIATNTWVRAALTTWI